MEITLEKIELVKDRTGVTYKEAKEALENAGGNVVDAIIAIEETVDCTGAKKAGAKKDALITKMKEIAKKGNVSKIVVSRDGETIINIPLTVGILGTVVAPWGMIAGTVAAFGFKCKVEFVKDDGSVVDITEKAEDLYGDAVEKGSDFYADFKEKAPDMYDDFKEKSSNVFAKAKGFAQAAKDKITKDDVSDIEVNICDGDCEHCEDVCEDFDDFDGCIASDFDFDVEFGDIADEAEDKFEDFADKAEEKIEDLADRAEDKIEELADKADDKLDSVEDAVEEALRSAVDKNN